MKYTFTNKDINLSTDYDLLYELIQNDYRIPAWLVYSDKYESPIWDIVEVKMRDGEYRIGVRGIGYEMRQTIESFKEICEMYSLHFYNPTHDPTRKIY